MPNHRDYIPLINCRAEFTGATRRRIVSNISHANQARVIHFRARNSPRENFFDGPLEGFVRAHGKGEDHFRKEEVNGATRSLAESRVRYVSMNVGVLARICVRWLRHIEEVDDPPLPPFPPSLLCSASSLFLYCAHRRCVFGYSAE